MSLEKVSKFGLPFYGFHANACAWDRTPRIIVDHDLGTPSDMTEWLVNYLHQSQRIIDWNILLKCKNKAAIMKYFYIPNSYTVGFVMDNRSTASRFKIFGSRTTGKTFLNEKYVKNVKFLLDIDVIEASNVTEKVYKKKVRELEKVVSQ